MTGCDPDYCFCFFIHSLDSHEHLQFYADNQAEEPNMGKSSKSETINFFLNCLLLLLGRLDNQQFENAITESGSQISQVLMSQVVL